MREKTVSVRFAAAGGDAVKAEMRGIGQTGRDAMQEITGSTGPASAGLDTVSTAAQQARAQLEAIAAKASASAAAMRTTAQATTSMQDRVNRATVVTTASGKSTAQILQEGQALDQLRAKYNPLFAVVQRYKQEVQEIRAANLQQAISEDEKAAAISRARQAALADIAVIKNRAGAINRQAGATRAGTMRLQQISYQLNDIGVSLAGGMNPFMVLTQQGSQIAQIYGFGNGGVGAIFRDLGRMLGGFVRRMPLLTAGLAVFAGAVAGMRHGINESQKVLVSFGDVGKAIFQVLGRYIGQWLKPAIDKISGWFSGAWDLVVAGVRWVGNALINGVRVAVDGIKTGISTIPSIFEAAFWGAAEKVFAVLYEIGSGAEGMVDAIAQGMNKAFGTKFKPIVFDGVGSLDFQRYSAGKKRDAANASTSAAWDAFADRTRDTMNSDPMGQFYEDVKNQSIRNAKTRAEKDKKKGGRSEKDEVADLVKELQKELVVLRETDPVKKKMLEYSDKLANATAEEKKQVFDLVSTLDKAKNGWEAVGRALAGYAEDAKRIGGDIGDSLTGAFGRAEDAWGEFVKTGKFDWRDLITSMAADLAKLTFRKNVLGPVADWIGTAISGAFGGSSAPTSSIRPRARPSFDGGGWTGSGPRSGGVDGKGGFEAILHPNERVIDYTKGEPGSLEVHIHENASDGGHRVERSRGRVDVYLKRAVTEVISGGGADGAMKRRYGLVPAAKGA